ncbi:hypothetical protein [Spiroplasma floricola]|uniref:Uncharacterized protein n=1 Tax=Spiroplasma floricola 23-6 TaxID=1336749 RepID=A0A2K8SEG7_9MOLU|nr:hypothetical protein [Spiroplasma floricola]AUB31831.1 hypothetical protein SFLOR_v1c07830 [Spiroplasma floricola 23-6]
MIRWDTIVTDVLAAIGLAIIILAPLIFCDIQRKILKQRLHTRVDGEKLFEKLKYDLKLSQMSGISKTRLYKDIDYAKTIFRGAMDYNSREVVWYFNELFAKRHINSTIRKKSWLQTGIWVLTILVIGGGSYLDILDWLFNMTKMKSDSGIVSIWVLFFFANALTSLVKYTEFTKVKTVINDQVRQINLTKKEKVWKDYKIVYWISWGAPVVGFSLIVINIFFK